jgi:hypothetical protein
VSTRPRVLTPLAPDRCKVQFTVTRDTHDKLRQVQDLLRHSVPDGDMVDRVRRSYLDYRYNGHAMFASIEDHGGPILMDKDIHGMST